MNILHISPYVPSLKATHAGGVCMGKEVEFLTKNYNLYVLTFVNNKNELRNEAFNRNFSYVKSGMFSKMFNILLNFNKPHLFAIRGSIRFAIKMVTIIKKNNIDVIHAEYTAMGQFYWIKKLFPHIKFNLVQHDVVSQSYDRLYLNSKGIKKIYYLIQKKKVFNAENKYCSNCDIIFVLNEKDKKLMKKKYNLRNVETLNPYYGLNFQTLDNNTQKIKNSICFVGLMNREENHMAAMRLINIFNNMKKEDLFLSIIGAYPKDELLEKKSKNINITGFVDDIIEEISKHEIAVFPLQMGAGIKFKILQAFGLGLPIITTDVGAEGIDEEGKILIIANSDKEIEANILNIFNNRDILEKKSIEGISFVKDKFDWKKSEELLAKIYK